MNARNAHRLGAPGYRLVRWLVTSGAASLYAATEVPGGQPVAIKIFHRADAAGIARLEQRLRVNAKLSHPNIVAIGETGRTADGRLFHSMPLLLGFEQVRHDLRGRPRRIAALLRDLLNGLDYAHRCGMVHGAIRPSNVLFDKRRRARLADFGIAHCAAEAGSSNPPASRYLSPEQARGDPPDPRSDLYAIGMLAYQLLTDGARIQARNASTPAEANAGKTIPRLPPALAAWQAWIDRALADSPQQRFQTAGEMAHALGVMLAWRNRRQMIGTTRHGRVPKWMLPAAVLLALVVVLVGWGTRGSRPAPADAIDTMPAATAFGTPAPPTTIAAAVPADSTPLLAKRVQGLIATADALRARGHLFAPPFHNAANHYLAALAFDPGNPDAIAGIDAMLATLRDRIDKAWDDDRKATKVVVALQQGDTLARAADASTRRDWRRYRDKLAQQVGDAVVQAAHAHDLRKIAALEPLAETLPAKFPAGFDLADAKRVASTPAAGARMRDPRGPLLVYVPAADGAPAFAIARVEVTRADYASFVRATHRPAAKCRAAHNPLSWLRHLGWQTPGFAQGNDYPVVCVSWDDAVAYATWLSKTTGRSYRLPGGDEWLRAAQGMPKDGPCKLGNVDDASRTGALDNDRLSCDDGAAQTAPVGHYAASGVGAYDMYGNVSEWLAGGSPGSRLFRGLSWRDGSHETPLGNQGSADSDIGYTSVGFRVMRVIDAAHGTPPPASAP